MATDQKTTINATPLVEKVEFSVGVSQKNGNAYVVGACYIKSPIPETPIRLGFDYIDPNTQELRWPPISSAPTRREILPKISNKFAFCSKDTPCQK